MMSDGLGLGSASRQRENWASLNSLSGQGSSIQARALNERYELDFGAKLYTDSTK